MTDGSGTTYKPWLGEWTHDPACSCSKTSLGCLLQTAGTLWPESLMVWPPSATWDGTGFYERPMLEPATSDADGSALPTPNAQESDPKPEMIEEMRAAGISPDERLYLPDRKWHSQRTLRRIVSQLPKPQTAPEDRTTPEPAGETPTTQEEMTSPPP